MAGYIWYSLDSPISGRRGGTRRRARDELEHGGVPCAQGSAKGACSDPLPACSQRHPQLGRPPPSLLPRCNPSSISYCFHIFRSGYLIFNQFFGNCDVSGIDLCEKALIFMSILIRFVWVVFLLDKRCWSQDTLSCCQRSCFLTCFVFWGHLLKKSIDFYGLFDWICEISLWGEHTGGGLVLMLIFLAMIEFLGLFLVGKGFAEKKHPFFWTFWLDLCDWSLVLLAE